MLGLNISTVYHLLHWLWFKLIAFKHITCILISIIISVLCMHARTKPYYNYMLITWFHRHTNQCSISFTKCGKFFVFDISKWIKSIVIKACKMLQMQTLCYWQIDFIELYMSIAHAPMNIQEKTRNITTVYIFQWNPKTSTLFGIFFVCLLYSVAFHIVIWLNDPMFQHSMRCYLRQKQCNL